MAPDHRGALVAAGTQVHIQRDGTEQRYRVGERLRKTLSEHLTAARTEHVEHGTVRQGHGSHVLDHAHDLLTGLQAQGTGTLRHIHRGVLRGGNKHQLRIRQQLSHGDGNIAGAGRQIEQQHIQGAEVHVHDELLQGTV